jgi:beta-lactamase regulating signal transducer with metallopeptidase domain
MTALWISLAVVVAVLLVWRLRRATKVLDRIMREELEETAAEPAERHAEHRKR